MAKIFRRIRQTLLTENKVSKYLIYAVGEIILVVVGILIALEIDNRSEQIKMETKELAFLNRLLVDLKNDQEYLELVRIRKDNKVEAANTIIKFSFNGNNDSIMHIIPYYLQLTSWQAVIPNQNTFNELISSGSLNILSNDSIKNGLLQLDRNYKALIDWEEVVKQDDYIGNFWTDRNEFDPYNYLSVNKPLVQALGLDDKITREQKLTMQKQLRKDVDKILKSYKFRTGVLSTRDDYVNQLTLIEILRKDVENLIRLLEKELLRDN